MQYILGCIKSNGEVLSRIIRCKVIIRDLVREEGVEDGTECKTIRPTLAEILDVDILCRERKEL